MERTVQAAGGLVYRPRDDAIEIAVVHRPKYDDWTLPKGKLDEGESEEQAALREVEEETGLHCEIGKAVGEVHYRTSQGPKRVVYFAMRVVGGEFRPNREVDEIRWLTHEEAAKVLTHEHDRRLVAGIDDNPPL
jgi:8-oxo-dGTP diphosphatase